MRVGWLRRLLFGLAWLGGSFLEASNAPPSAVPFPDDAGPQFLQLGSFLSVVPERCAVRFTVRVVANNEGGEDSFTLEVWDEGKPVRVTTLSVPADGGTHERSGRIELPPVSEVNPGVAVLLKDNATVLDVEDPVLAPCVAFDVPAVNTGGLVVLSLLLGSFGLIALSRFRSAKS